MLRYKYAAAKAVESLKVILSRLLALRVSTLVPFIALVVVTVQKNICWKCSSPPALLSYSFGLFPLLLLFGRHGELVPILCIC